MPNNVLFLTLKVFSSTGGIEKVSRLAGKALHDLCSESRSSCRIYAMYDHPLELMEKYFPAPVFEGFKGNRVRFVLQSIRKGIEADLVVLSHINLLSVGYMIKKLSPKTRVILIAHGIEVWEPLPAWKKAMLRSLDLILPVSRFTKKKMLELYGLEEQKLVVVNNCLDPFLPKPIKKEKSVQLLEKYGLEKEARVILTLTRLSFSERYKGYDEVLMAIKALQHEEPNFRYLIVGKYDEEEKARLDRLIMQQGLENRVIFAGFIPDEELADHFNLADAYVMPSSKEGFGIVFIEALYYGLPVIAGNVDGSVDALGNGKLGLLVNPDQSNEIKVALQQVLSKKKTFAPSAEEVMNRFSFGVYKQRLRKALGFSFAAEESNEKKNSLCRLNP
jgi:glycosyltransferase involved in cell wall biosynthesis